jgi:hypothetical protein
LNYCAGLYRVLHNRSPADPRVPNRPAHNSRRRLGNCRNLVGRSWPWYSIRRCRPAWITSQSRIFGTRPSHHCLNGRCRRPICDRRPCWLLCGDSRVGHAIRSTWRSGARRSPYRIPRRRLRTQHELSCRRDWRHSTHRQDMDVSTIRRRAALSVIQLTCPRRGLDDRRFASASGRKVRAPQDRVVDNVHRSQDQG